MQLREEREQKDAEKSPRAEAKKRKHTPTASKKIKCLSDTSDLVKLHSVVKCAVTNIQKAGREEEENLVDEGWVSEGESEGKEDSLIPAGGLLEDMLTGDDGELARIVGRKVVIVTRPQRRTECVIYS